MRIRTTWEKVEEKIWSCFQKARFGTNLIVQIIRTLLCYKRLLKKYIFNPNYEFISALIRLNTNKLIYGIVSYGSNEGLITRINLKRETTYGAYETVGQFYLDSTSPESRRCFGTPFQAGSILVEIEAYEGRFEFNFNLLVQN